MPRVWVLMLCALAAHSQDSAWDNLRGVTRDRNYFVNFRDGHCEAVALGSVGRDNVVVRTASGSVTIERRDVVRVSDMSSAGSSDAIFNARSWWGDVMTLNPGRRESVRVTTKRGERLPLHSPTVLDDRIQAGARVVRKEDVDSVTFVRFRPLTSKEQYLEHEDVKFLSPRLWFGGWLLGKIEVRLYDSKTTQETAPLVCKGSDGS